ncbi:hypothetical protein JCM8547_007380 [Rhodosporidiobolus lusitaniae]
MVFIASGFAGCQSCPLVSLSFFAAFAPGGHLGRFVIWTEGAFAQLDEVFGTYEKGSALKSGYILPISKITNPDVTRIIQSEEVQAVLRAAGPSTTKKGVAQKNHPLRNPAILARLNLYAVAAKRAAILREAQIKAGKVKAAGHKQPLVKTSKEFVSTLKSA